MYACICKFTGGITGGIPGCNVTGKKALKNKELYYLTPPLNVGRGAGGLGLGHTHQISPQKKAPLAQGLPELTKRESKRQNPTREKPSVAGRAPCLPGWKGGFAAGNSQPTSCCRSFVELGAFRRSSWCFVSFFFHVGLQPC